MTNPLFHARISSTRLLINFGTRTTSNNKKLLEVKFGAILLIFNLGFLLPLKKKLLRYEPIVTFLKISIG